MNRTKIEWVKNPDGTQGYTWNPITGCLNGCEYCYARKLANTRLKERYLLNPKVADIDGQLRDSQSPLWDRVIKDPFYPRFWEDRLTQVSPDQKPRGIFPCDMSDLFGIGIPEYWTQSVLWHIDNCPQHRFYLLTKQPQNLPKWSPFPQNCWVGVSVTNKEYLGRACYIGLAEIEASVKFISFEPLQGKIELRKDDLIDCGINWVIIGAQTKPYRPPAIADVQEIVEACDKAGVAVFLKDNLFLPDGEEPFFKCGNDGDWRIRQEVPR